MKNQTYRALIAYRDADGNTHRRVETRSTADLPDGDLLVRVKYSSLNYKDALSAAGRPGVTKRYPHQPGIDAAGIVVESGSPDFERDDAVIVFGRDLGMNTPGGFGEYIRVPAEWAVPLPAGLTLHDAMIFGTAGFTAAMAVEEVTRDLTPEDGELLVTGATGGVGSFSVAILSQLGYRVCAVSGKTDAVPYLTALGAQRVIDREAATSGSEKPLLSAEWTGVVDTVAGPILGRAIKACAPHAVVAACGNASSPDVPVTVFPFILRGVRLVGIDSPTCGAERRRDLWSRLAGAWRPRDLSSIGVDVDLESLSEKIDAMLVGGVRGRVVVAHREG